jgi:ATP-dependent Lhr-like helicase
MSENVFRLLHPEVRDLATERFEQPTPVQTAVVPEILKDRNVLVISETGSGKTESCLLPLFDRMMAESLKPISILYITPLKSLNRDLLKRILWWSRKLSFDVSVRHGDTSQYERGMQAQNPPDMMISTPETLQAILVGKLMREHLKNVRYVVIDEIHGLVNSKRGVQLSVGIERLKNLIRSSGKPEPTMIALSATIGNPGDISKFLGEKVKVVNTEKQKKISARVEYPAPGTSPEKRLEYIADRINEKESVLVFTNTRESAEILSFRLKNMKNLKIETHHSSLSKEVRMKAEDNFKNGSLKALLCTSSLELGIDIGRVDFIIQYSSPRQVSKLVQRVGRSGHSLDRVSEGIIITTSPDDCFESTVIADMALSHQVEPSEIYGKSLDVLGHQIVGLSIEEYRIPLIKAYEMIKKVYPFRNLSQDEFFEVCRFMERLGYVWLDYPLGTVEKGEKADLNKISIKRRKKAFEFYFSNLSTIPDVKTYRIFDTFSRQNVGTLDAEFIALHGSAGTLFIVKGQGWRILDITEDRVFVEPLHSTEAAIPAWEGELIPVPFEVAMGVGQLRREITKYKNPAEYLKKYPISPAVAKIMVKTLKKQKAVPTDKDILIEYGSYDDENFLVIHSCFGSKVNETIGRTVSTLLAGKFGSIGLKTDPYRIVFKLKNLGDWKDFVQMFKGLKPEIVKSALQLSLPNTELFQWRFTHVAKRFGIISKDADFGKAYLRNVIKAYDKTPVFRETMNEIFREKLDVEKAGEAIRMMRGGKIKITIKEGLSHLGMLGIESRYELLGADRPEGEIFNIFKKRLLETRIGLLCTNCGTTVYMGKAGGVKEPACRKCGSKLVGITSLRRVHQTGELLKKNLQNGKLTEEDKKLLERFLSTSYLIAASGADAVKVLAGRGIGPKTASRILSRRSEGDELFREILRAERQFTKTRRFWSGDFG